MVDFRDIEPLGNKRLQAVRTAFWLEFQDEPAAAVQHFRELCLSRTEETKKDDFDWKLGWLRELLINYVENLTGSWAELMKDGGLPDVYIHLMQSEGFLNEERYLTSNVFLSLAAICKACETLGHGERFLLPRFSALFHYLWQNRALLKHCIPEARTYAENGRPCALRLVYYFSQAHKKITDRWPGLDTYIPQLSIYCWVCLRNVCFLPAITESVSSLSGVRKRTPAAEDEISLFVQDTIVNIIGLEALFVCFEEELATQNERDTLSDVLSVMAMLHYHPSACATLQERQTFRCIVEHFTRRSCAIEQTDDGITRSYIDWRLVFPVFQATFWDTSGQPEKNMLRHSTKGTAALEYLACGSRFIAQSAFRRLFQLDSFSDVEDPCVHIVKHLKVLCKHAKLLDSHSAAPLLADSMMSFLRAEWLPLLDILRAGQRQILPGAVNQAFSQVIRAWEDLGAVLQLDQVQMRKEARKFCSYQSCSYHLQTPPGTLSTCRGCGDVRYCGKECQRRDWKAIHKRMCGKRLM